MPSTGVVGGDTNSNHGTSLLQPRGTRVEVAPAPSAATLRRNPGRRFHFCPSAVGIHFYFRFFVDFFSLLQLSFIITHAIFRHGKTFLTSDTLPVLRVLKHLVFTSFPPLIALW